MVGAERVLIPAIRFSRTPRRVKMPPPWLNASFRFGVLLRRAAWNFRGEHEEAERYSKRQSAKWKNLAGKIEIDFLNLPRAAADLLYKPWVAERLVPFNLSFVGIRMKITPWCTA